jgi:hypothetical protein
MKLVREYINEKFTEDSDPIKDLGIGVYCKHNFNTENELLQWIWLVLPTLFGGTIPKNIIYNTKDTTFFNNNRNWYNVVEKYMKQYITLNGNTCELSWNSNNALHNALMRKGYRISKGRIEYWKRPEFEDKPGLKIKE